MLTAQGLFSATFRLSGAVQHCSALHSIQYCRVMGGACANVSKGLYVGLLAMVALFEIFLVVCVLIKNAFVGMFSEEFFGVLSEQQTCYFTCCV